MFYQILLVNPARYHEELRAAQFKCFRIRFFFLMNRVPLKSGVCKFPMQWEVTWLEHPKDVLFFFHLGA